MSAPGTLTPAERRACQTALRHYPSELVARAQEGTMPHELVEMGFSSFQVTAVRNLLMRAGVLRV